MADDKHCKNCFYYRYMYNGYKEMGRACHYLLITGKRRPCDPGKDCTVKVTEKPRWGKKKTHAKHEKAPAGGGAVLYEIRKDGVTCCQSYLPLGGFDLQTIEEMQRQGFELYADGKLARR